MTFDRKRIPKHLIIKEHYETRPHRPQKNLSWRWLGVGAFVICSCLVFAMQSRADTRPNVGELAFRTSTGVLTALHLKTKVKARISGLIAEVVYTQEFKNQSREWQTGHYSFPLPETAGVKHMEIRIGERIIIGEVKEKHEAKRIFKQAIKEGKRAALTEQKRPNMFTQKIANIGPNETVTVVLTYQHKITFRNAQFEWRLPTTFTPRYISGRPLDPSTHPLATDKSEDEVGLDLTQAEENEMSGTVNLANKSIVNNDFGWATATDEVADAHLITPYMTHIANPISINITLNSGLTLANIDSLYHDIEIKKNNDEHHIALQTDKVEMDRDFVLQWAATPSSTPKAALFTEQIDDDFYSLLMLVPPSEGPMQELARDIIFIIDTSGSMQGPSITQARQSLSLALQQLSNKDRFNVIEFNSQHSTLFGSLKPATQQNTQVGLHWVDKLRANGGTEMLPALKAAFLQMPESERLKQVVFITDGAIGNEAALLKLIHQELKSSRLFTVGIGSAPNSYFMRKAAEFGRGTFSHIGQSRDISPVMTALFSKLNSAVSTNIKIDWPTDVEQYPRRIGELYRDEALLLAVKSQSRPDEVAVSGELNQRKWQQTLKHTSTYSHPGIGTVWAKEKIEHIEDQGTTGMLSKEDTKRQILDVALTHKIISRFTSFIAVDKVKARPQNQVLKNSLVKNQVPRGQQSRAVVLPQTATTGEIAWWFGFFAFVAFILVWRMKGNER